MFNNTDNNHVIIFDTTLRDGEQSPGASMYLDEKLRIAEILERMGVDVIEAGFAIASKGDFEAIHEIAKKTTESTVCSLARANRRDIECAAEALLPASGPSPAWTARDRIPRISSWSLLKRSGTWRLIDLINAPVEGTVSREMRQQEFHLGGQNSTPGQINILLSLIHI
mgnify:CR=1 FL=1